MTVVPIPEGAADRIAPPVSPASEPFWEATREPRLVLQWCASCDRPIHFPREACPRCLSDDLGYRDATGRGTVHAVSVMPKPANPSMAGRAPYAVALVDLDEGARLLTDVVVDDPWSVTIGQRVSVVWEPLPDGRHLPRFAPDPDRSD
jgi:uncharacterized OB-fold protein